MIELRDLLGRFEKIISKGEVKLDLIAEILSKYSKTKINKKDISIVHGNIFLNLKPIFKNELFLHKEEVQSELKVLLGGVFDKNVR